MEKKRNRNPIQNVVGVRHTKMVGKVNSSHRTLVSAKIPLDLKRRAKLFTEKQVNVDVVWVKTGIRDCP